MSVLQVVGVAIYMMGHGYRGMPGETGLVGSVLMIAGGIMFLLSIAVNL